MKKFTKLLSLALVLTMVFTIMQPTKAFAAKKETHWLLTKIENINLETNKVSSTTSFKYDAKNGKMQQYEYKDDSSTTKILYKYKSDQIAQTKTYVNGKLDATIKVTYKTSKKGLTVTSKQGKIVRDITVYDKKGRRKNCTIYNTDGNVLQYMEYDDYEFSNYVEYYNYGEDGSLDFISTIKYNNTYTKDKKIKKVESAFYTGIGNCYLKRIEEYNTSGATAGKLKKVTEYSEDAVSNLVKTNETTYKYTVDKNKNVTVEKGYNEEGTLISEVKNTYKKYVY